MGLKLREKKKFNKLVQQEASDIVKAATTPTITEEDGKLIAESDTMEPRALDEMVVSAKRGNYSNVGSSDAVNERIGQLWRNKFSGPGMFDDNLNGRKYNEELMYKDFLERERKDRKKDRLRIATYNNIYPWSYNVTFGEISRFLKDYFNPNLTISYDNLANFKNNRHDDKNEIMFENQELQRNEAFRIAMGIPDKYSKIPGLYILNSDGTYSIDRDKLYQIKNNDRIFEFPVEPSQFRHSSNMAFHDTFINNHGTVKVVKDGDKYTMEDDWTLRPLRSDGFLPHRLRELEFVDLVGGNPFVLRQDISDMNKDSLDAWTKQGRISKYHIIPSNYMSKQALRKNRQWFLKKYRDRNIYNNDD